MVEVMYRWHPLQGERLRLYQRSGRGGREILYLEALGARTSPQLHGQEASDEPEDHA